MFVPNHSHASIHYLSLTYCNYKNNIESLEIVFYHQSSTRTDLGHFVHVVLLVVCLRALLPASLDVLLLL